MTTVYPKSPQDPSRDTTPFLPGGPSQPGPYRGQPTYPQPQPYYSSGHRTGYPDSPNGGDGNRGSPGMRFLKSLGIALLVCLLFTMLTGSMEAIIRTGKARPCPSVAYIPVLLTTLTLRMGGIAVLTDGRFRESTVQVTASRAWLGKRPTLQPRTMRYIRATAAQLLNFRSHHRSSSCCRVVPLLRAPSKSKPPTSSAAACTSKSVCAIAQNLP